MRGSGLSDCGAAASPAATAPSKKVRATCEPIPVLVMETDIAGRARLRNRYGAAGQSAVAAAVHDDFGSSRRGAFCLPTA